MIPRAAIIGWQTHAPWSDLAQVEQDLVLSRALVELFSDPRAADRLAFRGGTALHKLHLTPAARYSEDIDLVQIRAGPAKPLFSAIRDRLDSWVGAPRTKTKRNGVQLLYGFETSFPPVRRMRVKVEVNTREHFSELGFTTMPFTIDSAWFSGGAEITTYSLDELLGTKLRALYQRKKGRDVFDLWLALEQGGVDPEAVLRCFRAYMSHGGHRVSQVEFMANVDAKSQDVEFREDILPLLRTDMEYDHAEAITIVQRRLVSRL